MKTFDIFFFFNTFYFYSLPLPWSERIFILFFKYIYFVWVKLNGKRGNFILTGVMLKIMFILNQIKLKQNFNEELCQVGYVVIIQ